MLYSWGFPVYRSPFSTNGPCSNIGIQLAKAAACGHALLSCWETLGGFCVSSWPQQTFCNMSVSGDFCVFVKLSALTGSQQAGFILFVFLKPSFFFMHAAALSIFFSNANHWRCTYCKALQVFYLSCHYGWSQECNCIFIISCSFLQICSEAY